MRKIVRAFSVLIVAFVLFMSIPLATCSETYAASKATVNTTEKVKILESGLRMRASYTTDSAIKGKVTKGKIYQLKKRTKDCEWGQLKSNGYWIYLKGYTRVVKDTVSTTQKVKVLETGLRMRANYTTTAEIKGKVTKGKVYPLKKKTKDGEWGQLKSNGYWICLEGYTTVYKDTVSSSDKVKIISKVVNKRKNYTSDSKRMGQAKKGEVYQLKRKTVDGCWGQLKDSGYWISLKDHTQLVKDVDSDSADTDENTDIGNDVVKCNEKVKIIVTGLRMRENHSTSAKIMGAVNIGVIHELKAKTKDGKWGQLKSNGYWIYIADNYTVRIDDSADANVVLSSDIIKVTAKSLNMRESYTVSSKAVGKVKPGVCYKLRAKTKDGKWGQLESNEYWISLQGYTKQVDQYTYLNASDQVNNGKAVSGLGTGEEVVAYAKLFLGNPYVHGEKNLLYGTDCSGYTKRVYEHFGINIPHASVKQVNVGKKVAFKDAKPGDLICYSGHVALYLGNNSIIHASSPSTGIKISTNAQYKPILCVRRIFE